MLRSDHATLGKSGTRTRLDAVPGMNDPTAFGPTTVLTTSHEYVSREEENARLEITARHLLR